MPLEERIPLLITIKNKSINTFMFSINQFVIILLVFFLFYADLPKLLSQSIAYLKAVQKVTGKENKPEK